MEEVKTFVNHGEVSDGEFLRSMKREIKPYWDGRFINTPDDSVKLRVDPISGKPFWDMYWETMVERQNIWHKRVVQGLPKPWTDDPVLSVYHFTNVNRDLDRVTLYYIDKVLGAFKENYNSISEKEEAKAFLLLNTFIYRLFVRPTTWDVIGYITPNNFEEDWNRAKANLRELKASGKPVFTDAYYVNDLKSANPDRANSSDKTENAIWLIQFIIDNLREIADFTFNPENSMEDCINKFTMIPAVGLFNAYEASLDMGIVTKYTGIPFVEWTPDHYINPGPGNKQGIDYLFEEKGNMSYHDINYFTLSVHKHEFERLGLDYKYEEGATELNARCSEGWFCEFQKYLNWYSNEHNLGFAKKKRPKKKMNLRTEDRNWLKPR